MKRTSSDIQYSRGLVFKATPLPLQPAARPEPETAVAPAPASGLEPRPVVPSVDPPVSEDSTALLWDRRVIRWLDALDRQDRPTSVVWAEIRERCGGEAGFSKVLNHLLSPCRKAVFVHYERHIRLQTEWIRSEMPVTLTDMEAQVHRTERFLRLHWPASERGLNALLDQVQTLERIRAQNFSFDDHAGHYLNWILVGSASRIVPCLLKLIRGADMDDASRDRLAARAWF